MTVIGNALSTTQYALCKETAGQTYVQRYTLQWDNLRKTHQTKARIWIIAKIITNTVLFNCDGRRKNPID